MAKSRAKVLLSLLRGLAAAIAITLLGMAVIAALAVYLRASDAAIRVMNQVLKGLAILSGAFFAIGQGGENGFVKGMALAIVYMFLGFLLVTLLGGSAFSVGGMLGEILIGAALGAAAGAVYANLPERRRRVRGA